MDEIIEQIKSDLNALPPKPIRSCSNCGRQMTSNVKTSAGNQQWVCRTDRGGCGQSETEGGLPQGGQTIGKEKMTGYERLKRHREKKRKEKLS